MVIEDVNVTEVPEQMLVLAALMLIVGVTVGLTVIVRLADVTVVGDTQGALLVSWQLIWSPLASVVVV